MIIAMALAVLLAADPPRQRARDLGIVIGTRTPGKWNAITDVAGVRVGHVTLSKGNVRTGVTAVVPPGDVWLQKVPAATWVLNGAGEMTGSIWIDTIGALEVPVVITNTMNIGNAMNGVVQYMLKQKPAIGLEDNVVAPTVAECDDSFLNDARGLHVSAADTVKAIETAASGPVAEGAVGAGTGMTAFEWKAGIGTSSRVLTKEEGGYTVGVIVNANMDRRASLKIDGVAVGKKMPELMPGKKPSEGSIIVILATDAPLDHLALKRLASKAALGLARTGANARNGSGDIFLAFSTGNRVPHVIDKGTTFSLTVVGGDHMNPLFEAAADATEEAILNSLTMATTTTGRDGNTAYAIPLDKLRTVMKR